MASESNPQWSSKAYADAAGFVPNLTSKLQKYIFSGMKKDSRVLDVGCGDGILTGKIASYCSSIIGLDSSASFIDSAREKIAVEHPNAEFYVVDCRRLNGTFPHEKEEILDAGTYDMVMSNAAMHWILRDESTRHGFFEDISKLLKPGGLFVFEMGGPGNVIDAHTAIVSVLHCQHGISIEKIRDADPWFFPSENWMKQTLEAAGFAVELVEAESRPTKMTESGKNGQGGLEGWVRLMGNPFLGLLESQTEKDRAVSSIVTALSHTCRRPEEEDFWLSYVRLRAVAQKT